MCEAHIFGSFNLLGLDYTASGDVTRVHKQYPWWSGSDDGTFDKGVFDLKSPYTLKSFYRLSKAIQTGDINIVRGVKSGYQKVGEEYYWQLVSNACIHEVDQAELIVYMPFEEELDAIRDTASGMDNLNDYAWVNWSLNEQLPHIKSYGSLPNVNKIRIEIQQSDKDFLNSKMIEFGSRLVNYSSEFEAV